MLIQDRIHLIIKANKLSASEFASKIDINRSNLSHVLSGRNKPSLHFLSKILTSFPNVNASWLITGETMEGSFSEDSSLSENKSDSVVRTVSAAVSNSEVEKIVVFYKDGTFKEYSPA